MADKILIIGGCGFVGSQLSLYLKKKHPRSKILVMDSLMRRGSEENLPSLQKNGIEFIHGDIRVKEDFDKIPKVDWIMDAAAEPSVTAGLTDSPYGIIQTNLMGTIHCLELARKYKSSVIFLSSSRIYPIDTLHKIKLEEQPTRFKIAAKQTLPGVSQRGISENFPLFGSRSFYGTTKLSAEYLLEEYRKFYGIKGIVNRCGLISGPGQMGKPDQGVIALWVARHFWKQPLSYIGYKGSGKQIRDVINIEDLCDLISIQMKNIKKLDGNIYNVGGGSKYSISLLELTGLCEEIIGNKISIKKVKEVRVADIPIYITNNSKVTKDTGWKPHKNVSTTVTEIFEWINNNEKNLKRVLG